MKQTWENRKKPSFETNFGHFGPNLDPKIFFHDFYLYFMLYIVANYHCMQFQEKLMNQLEKIAKNLLLGPQFFFSKIWLRQALDFMVSYHHVQYQKKLIIQS